MRNARILPAVFFGLLLGLATNVQAQPDLPYQDGQIHEGVATCAGSNCHGASQVPDDSTVLQNEYFIWTREDRHAQAYKTLLNAASKKIGRRLGLVPEESPRCLNCHSNNIPKEQRGKRFRLADGVSCEACHGGAGQWLRAHVEAGATHAKNLAAGLYPTDEPQQRARLCLSCHLGNQDHPIDHQIMGAGHPPLGFELDTFSAIQPAHFVLDDDYEQRKGIRSSAQTWADGQMVTAQRFLQEVASERLQQGAFPELVFFDCYACHHDMSNPRWDTDSAPGLGVGRVRLHQANLLLVEEILKAKDAAQAKALQSSVRQLNQASNQSLAALQKAAQNSASLMDQVIQQQAGQKWSDAQIKMLLVGVSERAIKAPDFNLAEQSNMALEALYLTLDFRGKLSPAQSKKIRSALDKGYSYTNDVDDYSTAGYTRVMRQIRDQLK